MHPRLAKWLVGVLLMTLATRALAENRLLRRAQLAYEQLEYDKVTPLLKKALAEPGTEPAEEIEIFTLLATMHVMYGRDAKAEEAFVEILERQPDFELPADSSPKLAAAFAAAAKLYAERAANPEDAEPRDADPRDAEPNDSDNEVQADDRVGGDTASHGGGVSNDDIMDPTAGRVAEPTPFYSTWWFWTAVGVVVAGAAGTTTYLVTRPRFPETEFGPYDL